MTGLHGISFQSSGHAAGSKISQERLCQSEVNPQLSIIAGRKFTEFVDFLVTDQATTRAKNLLPLIAILDKKRPDIPTVSVRIWDEKGLFIEPKTRERTVSGIAAVETSHGRGTASGGKKTRRPWVRCTARNGAASITRHCSNSFFQR
jgi:hypothetical protein